jgi:hypothetical protein
VANSSFVSHQVLTIGIHFGRRIEAMFAPLCIFISQSADGDS